MTGPWIIVVVTARLVWQRHDWVDLPTARDPDRLVAIA